MKMHMTVTREYLLGLLDAEPKRWRDLVPDAPDVAAARREIREGPPFHPIGECPEFDHQTGVCPGHASTKAPIRVRRQP